MFRFQAPKYSPVELEYLKLHREDMPIDQLCIALGKSRNSLKNQLLILDGKTPPKGKNSKKSKIGKRADLNQFVRSGWEANVLRWLKYKNIKYLYEPKVFVFDKIKHGTVSYLPDIYLPEEDVYLEVKGFMDKKSKTALSRFAKFYPLEFAKLKAIVGRKGTAADKFCAAIGIPICKYYNELDKEFKSIISSWE
jgi:hypothetical protein